MIGPVSTLLTDYYQLTMLQAYYREGLVDTASFELFVRNLPPERNFLVAAGLEQVLEFLKTFRLTKEECAWLSEQPKFTSDFVRRLSELRLLISEELKRMAERIDRQSSSDLQG
jgi:nicotinate phosphoribosyltransferase